VNATVTASRFWIANNRRHGGRYVRFSWGHPELMIQRVLRHANVSVTQTHYIKTVDADAVAAMDALEVSFAGRSRKAAVIVPPHVN